jgi:quinol monooxygenase YgiN
MVLTILEAHLPPGQEEALRSAYQEASAGRLPAGLVHSELLCDARDNTRWRIQTWWSSRAALDAMRNTGTPAGVLMFRAAKAEPTVSIFDIVDSIPRGAGQWLAAESE